MSVLLKDILEKTLVSLDKDIPTVREKVSQFLLDNAWFGVSIDTNVFSVSEAEATILKDKVKDFLTVQPGMDTISVILKRRYPATQKYFMEYARDSELDEASQFYIQDFLAYYLAKDLFLYTDKELEKLIEQATETLSKKLGDNCISFISWLLSKGVTHYRNTYEMTKLYTLEDKNGAY